MPVPLHSQETEMRKEEHRVQEESEGIFVGCGWVGVHKEGERIQHITNGERLVCMWMEEVCCVSEPVCILRMK